MSHHLGGFHAVMARLARRPASVQALWLADSRGDARVQALLALAEQAGIVPRLVATAELDALCRVRHQGVVAQVAQEAPARSVEEVLEDCAGRAEPPLLLVLDGVTDPHNLGACLRVADAMGADAVIAPKDRAASLNATVSRVACGAAEVLPFLQVTNLARTLRALKDAGIWLVGADMDGESLLYAHDQTGPLAWVMGSEGEGMRRLTRDLCDVRVRIPMLGVVQSLNASVAAGVCLSETRRQRGDGRASQG